MRLDYCGLEAPGTSPVVLLAPPFVPEPLLVVVPLPLVEPLALPVVVPLDAPAALPLVVAPLPLVVAALPVVEPVADPLLTAAPLFEAPLGLAASGFAELVLDGEVLFIGVPLMLFVEEPFMSAPLLVEEPLEESTFPLVPWEGGWAEAPVEEPALPAVPPLAPSETPPVEPPEAPPPETPAPPEPPPAPPPPPPAAASRYWSGVAALILENGRLSRARLASHE